MAEPAYTAKDITVLEGLEPVRLRPGMYIGSTGSRGLHHLVYEVVDNAVDEALAGRNDLVDVTIHPDNSVTVRDAGAGIPVDVIAEQGMPALTVVLTKLHAGGKFGGEGYKVSGGLHGVGVSVVNALSEWLVAEVRRDGKVYRQEFARGEPTGDMKKIGVAGKGESGTTISFLPDPEVFEETEFDASTLLQRLRETAFLTRGLRIVIRDERAGGRTEEFHYEGGIKDFVAHVNEAKDPVHKHIVYFEGESDEGAVEVAMQWNGSYVESVFSFANNINTTEGGAHLQGFRSALTRTLNQYARQEGLLKEKDDNLEGEDAREGLAAVISVKLQNPQFEGQTKTKLGNPGVAGLVETSRQPAAGRVPRGEQDRGAPDRHQGDRRPQRASGSTKGTRAHTSQERARELLASRKARRLHDQGPGVRGALHRRGRLCGRLREAGPRPHDSGDPASAREDHQLREEPHQQGALQHGDPGDDHRDRHGIRRRVRHLEPALRPRHRHDRRRRRRRAHPHARADLPVPHDARALRARPRLHRRPSALPREARKPGHVLREGRSARGSPRARAREGHDSRGARRKRDDSDRGPLDSPRPRSRPSRGMGREARGGVRPGCPVRDLARARRGRGGRRRRMPPR